MKAMRIHRFGAPDVLVREDMQVPEPGDGEVVVRVEAASVNPVDYKIRKGQYPAVPADELPVVLGRDLSGTVIASRDRAIGRGDELYAFIGTDRGSYAEYVVLRAGEYAPRPRRLDAVQAASVPLAALTAWQGLFDHGRLRAGERVLIHGGAGGVGHFAIQFARHAGAEVLTTVAARDRDFVRELGADLAIDYRAQRFDDLLRDVDLVFDLIGGDTQQRSWRVLKPSGGRLISTLAEPSREEAQRRNAHAQRYLTQPNAAQLAEIATLIDSGRVRPHLERAFDLEQAAAAHRYLEETHVRGKIVLDVHAS